MKAIAFINQKGGVGKSTTTLHTASYLVKKGYKVLTIDLDPQGNLSKAFGINTDGFPTLKEVLLGEKPVNEAIYSTNDFGYVIPSDIELGQAEKTISGNFGAEGLLALALEPIIEQVPLDYILIDCPPAFNIFTYNALLVATDVVIPCKAEQWSLDGAEQFFAIQELVKKRFKRNINVAGIVVNQFQSNITTQKMFYDILKQTAEKRNVPFIAQPIRLSTDVNTAIGMCKSVFDWKKNSNVAQDFAIAIDSFISNVKGE